MKQINKYYVGAEHIAEAIAEGTNAEWTQATLEEAVEKGKKLFDEEHRECVVIVKIIRILRRAKTPIIVEKV